MGKNHIGNISRFNSAVPEGRDQVAVLVIKIINGGHLIVEFVAAAVINEVDLAGLI